GLEILIEHDHLVAYKRGVVPPIFHSFWSRCDHDDITIGQDLSFVIEFEDLRLMHRRELSVYRVDIGFTQGVASKVDLPQIRKAARCANLSAAKQCYRAARL